MTSTTLPPALARFIEARADATPRAAAHAGMEACLALSRLLDAALVELAGEGAAFAVVAVGGSGRSEQARHSDIDVMLLIAGHADDRALRALYPLWDAGLKVGHSVRTVADAVEAGGANVETFTAILDARYLAGDRALFDRFVRARGPLVRGRRRWLRDELATRREQARQREPWQLLATDVKGGRGGLRDVQAVHWLDAAEAIARGDDPPGYPAALAEVHEHLLRTRNAVHALADRPTDVYRPEQARAVAEWLGVESLEWGRDLYAAMRAVDAAATARIAATGRWRLPWRRASRQGAAASVEASGISAVRALLRGAEAGGPLEPLGATPWLAALLPEWEVLRARPHIAPFHIHPVDVHVMRAVVEARAILVQDTFEAGTPAVAREFGDDDQVLLAMLLHDIGKGHGGGHPEVGALIAQRFAERAALPAEATRHLVTSVRLHLLLPNIATRRDIADPAVIAETAQRIGDAQMLRLLYLVSIADARASGPNVWSPWKAQLMRAFYGRLMAVLAADAPDAVLPTIEGTVAALRDVVAAETVRAHLRGMGGDYLVSTPPDRVTQHIEMIEAAAGGTAVRRDRLGELDRLTVVMRDRTGLIQAIAGTLAGHNASVLGGVAHTREDGVAIQVWHVTDVLGVGIDDRRWERILAAVPQAVAGTFPIDERLAEVRATYPPPARPVEVPTSVLIDNAASREYTVLEVSTGDRRGLLYGVTRLLHERRLDIRLAKVDTIGPEVVDAFYIRHEDGRRIDAPDEMERLRLAVLDVLDALDP